jgi:hypothetical protein
MSTDADLDAIVRNDGIERNWTGEFWFPVSHPCPPDEVFVASDAMFPKRNIFEHLNALIYTGFHIYFDPRKYSPLPGQGHEKTRPQIQSENKVARPGRNI